MIDLLLTSWQHLQSHCNDIDNGFQYVGGAPKDNGLTLKTLGRRVVFRTNKKKKNVILAAVAASESCS